ncbi:hypothetical protein HOY82DRAFT_69799 [Tuber indicum]|nr:hypothetical protein HOY82DRAFT_69799 [Tuber indicum]
MGAKYSTLVVEPTKIPNGIHIGHIPVLITDIYGGDRTAIPIVEYFGGKPTTPLDNIRRVDGLTVFEEGGKTNFRFSVSSSPSTLPDADSWLRLLASETYLRGHALFTRYVFVQGNKSQDNPRWHIFASAHSMMVKITKARDLAKTWTIDTVEGNSHSSGCYIRTAGIRISKEKAILIGLIEERTTLGEPVPLPHSFRYHPETGSESICQVMGGRSNIIKALCYQPWFGNGKVPQTRP